MGYQVMVLTTWILIQDSGNQCHGNQCLEGDENGETLCLEQDLNPQFLPIQEWCAKCYIT